MAVQVLANALRSDVLMHKHRVRGAYQLPMLCNSNEL